LSSGTWALGPEFWTRTLAAATNGMTSPHLFKDIIPSTAANADAVLAGFANIRRAHAQGTAITAEARVYVGEELRPDLLPVVLGAESWPDGGFVEWMQDLVGEQRFSLVLNTLESAAPALAAGLGEFMGSLMDGWGVPVGGAEQVAFVGNYAGTAFGVHEGYEHAFLTHYGPGTKDFYCWPADQYRKLTGGSEPLYGDYTWLLEHGEHFALEPGDALFLPERVFHVGRQSEFSISVAVPLYTFPDAAIVREFVVPDLLGPLLASTPDTDLGQPSPMSPLPDSGGQLAQRLGELTASVLTTAADQAAASARAHVHQRWNTILSNGGWQLVEADLGRMEAAAAFDPEQVQPGATAAVTAPYRLIVTGEQAFLRGCEVAVDPAVVTPDLVHALNTGPTTLPATGGTLAAVRALGATGGLTITPATTEETTA
jgi:hypothetical protein